VRKKLKPILRERETLASRLAGLEAAQERQEAKRGVLGQELENFKTGRVEAALAAGGSTPGDAEELARLRAAVELCEDLLLKIKTEIAAVKEAGGNLQLELYRQFDRARAEVHGAKSEELKEMHKAPSVLHVSCLTAMRGVFDDIMQLKDYSEFKWSGRDPRNVGIKRDVHFLLPGQGEGLKWSVYKVGLISN
jgi:hypothetical protein